MLKKYLKKNNYLIITIISLSFFLRFYDLNYNDLWYDEISSFWIANPLHDLRSSFKIHNYLEISPYTYHFILKILFNFFGYNTEVGRFFSAIISFGSIFLIARIALEINNIYSYKVALFFSGLNIFFITYAQEMRVYSILLFFSSLTYFLFLKCLSKTNNKNYYFFIISSLILNFLHPFSLLIFFSFVLFLVFKKLNFSFINSKLNYSLIIIFIISLGFYYHYIINIIFTESPFYWWSQITLKFFTNLYFSKFFGSRIMGLLFLLLLLYLITKNFSYLRKFNNLTLFFISLVIIYILPIIYGFIFQPILESRYIIFVLIPIIVLISVLINYEEKKLSKFIIYFYIIITFANFLTEQPFNNLYKSKRKNKPDYSSSVNLILDSKIHNYSIKVPEIMKSSIDSTKAIKNYIEYLSKNSTSDLNYVELDKSNNDFVWIICPRDIQKNCDINKENFKIILEEHFNNINLKLVEKYS